MGDDPYDFDIAIPSGRAANGGAYGGGGGGSAWGGAHSSGASDSDAASSSDASDVSISSDSDGKGRRHKTNGRTTAGGGGGRGVVGLRSAGPVAKGGGGGGGSTALDKAKSFLSKYSSKATPATTAQSSGRSRQLEMSLDDDEFSLDSSGDSARKPPASRKSVSRRGRPSASEEEDDDTKSGRSNEPHSDDDESTSRVANPPVAGVESARILQASSHNSDSVNPRPVSTAAASGSVPTTMAWRPSTTVEKTFVSADDDDEIESVASQSDDSDSMYAQRATPASACATVAIPVGTAVSVAASESGVYEDEEFEEGSANHVPSLHLTVRLEAEAAETPWKEEDEEESHVHYSLDFMEDGDAPGMTDLPRYDPPTPRATREGDTRSNASSSSERNKESYVEESSDGDHTDKQEADHDQATSPADDPQRIPSVETAKAANDESEEYDQDARFESESAANMPMSSQHNEPDPCVADKIGTRMDPTAASTARSSPNIVGTAQPSQASQPLACNVRERPRPRVQIIREYEQERGSVDKKDASTQFTGNHASIQTDVTPHGMLTGTEQRSSHDLPASIANEQTIELPSDRHGLSYVSPPAMSSEVRQAKPPVASPPPPPSAFNSYGLYDPLQLPTDVSMSMYKQQLLSLQQQIHQKKLETERLFRERISTRYTSLRGTERFLTSNRPSRMPLWEALLRIDPSLDEAKAKEIARMASDGAA